MLIPDDPQWLALVSGALSELTYEYNYEQDDPASVAVIAAKFRQILLDFWEGCPPTMPDLVYLRHEVAAGTGGGTLTAYAANDRPLTVKAVDTAGICTLNNPQFILPAGNYRISARSQAYGCGYHFAWLLNITDSLIAIIGSAAYSGYDPTESWIMGRLVLAAQKTFKIQHVGYPTTVANTGLGFPHGSQVEVYADVWIEREA